MPIKILIFGDIMGKIGRKALSKKLPALRKKYNPDLVIANCENMAHGLGVTVKTMREIFASGIDFCTSGNHIWNKEIEFGKVVKEKDLRDKVIRPANYKKIYKKPGEGYRVIKLGKAKILIINLLGRAFMKSEEEKIRLPLVVADEILKKHARQKIDAILIDLHAEATSEKRALGWFADGRASVVWGTHTHIPTADAQILPKGTGYITDLGMIGARDSVIGDNKDEIIEAMQRQKMKLKHNLIEKGAVVLQGIYVEIKNKKTIKIKQVLEETVVS